MTLADLYKISAREFMDDRWLIIRRAFVGAVNVVGVALIGQTLLWALDFISLSMGLQSEHFIVGEFRRWFPVIGTGGLLLYFMVYTFMPVLMSIQDILSFSDAKEEKADWKLIM